MFERFTDRARCVMDLAHREAQRNNHKQVGTEDILLAIVKEDRGAGATILQDLGVDLGNLLEQVERVIGSRPRVGSPEKPYQTAAAKKALEYAIDEARAFRHTFVDAEHILLGLLRDREGVAAQVLRNAGVEREQVRVAVLKRFGPGSEWPRSEQDRQHAGCQRNGERGSAVAYRQLLVWQKADQLARQVYALTAQLPQERIPGVASRLREIALSIPPHIAEAHDRRATGGAWWFLDVAAAALRELRYLLELAESLEGLQAEDLQGVVMLADEANRRLREFSTSSARQGMSPGLMGPSP